MTSIHDIADKHKKLSERRLSEKCCAGNEFMVGLKDKGWCDKCLTEFHHIERARNVFNEIQSGRITWGHIEAVVTKLQDLMNKPIPQKMEKYCEACSEQAKKRRRVE